MSWRLERRWTSRALPRPILQPEESDAPAVLVSRSVVDLPILQEEMVRADTRIAHLLLNLVRETAAARNDEMRLTLVLNDFAFRAFPTATHHVLAVHDKASGELQPLVARSRSGAGPEVALSRTIVRRVMRDGEALLFSHGGNELSKAHSIATAGMETAICAPLISFDKPFGVIQLDIRRPCKGMFSREDLDLLSVFAGQAGLALDNLRMHQQQRHALQSTVNALVHSLNLKDPETAHHCERVQAVALELGRALGLSDAEMETLGVAALVHDLGKQGIRDELLFKPDRLTAQEREEMAEHAAHTQNILNKIEYPQHLEDVPRVAAYHHEKMDGTGPFRIPAEEIPLASRIISVADVFDALISPRVYKAVLSVKEAIAILDRGKGVDWDPQVVQALRAIVDDLLATVYRDHPAGSEPDEGMKRAA